MDRNERQDLTIDKWKKEKGKGIALLPTGFGKTRVAMKVIQRLKDKLSDLKVVIVVPSDYLKKQWLLNLQEFNISDVCEIFIINSALNLVNKQCHLLVADEVHMFCSDNYITVFDLIQHQYFLGLTATLDRLDGKEGYLLAKYNVFDSITLEEAIKNKWVSEFKQYKVNLNVDLTDYIEYNTKFLHYFSYFNHDFKVAMASLKSRPVRIKLASFLGKDEREVMLNAMQFMRFLAKRKKFIYDHPYKIELANAIINARPNSKIITFTKHVSHAKQVCCGSIYHSKLKPKEKEKVVDEFNALVEGVMNTCKALDVGADIEGVNLGIIMSGDSSNISKKQKIGRTIRFSENKIAEIFTFVIKGTAEEAWFKKSNKNLEYEVIEDYQLDDLLNGNELTEKSTDLNDFIFIL